MNADCRLSASSDVKSVESDVSFLATLSLRLFCLSFVIFPSFIVASGLSPNPYIMIAMHLFLTVNHAIRYFGLQDDLSRCLETKGR